MICIKTLAIVHCELESDFEKQSKITYMVRSDQLNKVEIDQSARVSNTLQAEEVEVEFEVLMTRWKRRLQEKK